MKAADTIRHAFVRPRSSNANLVRTREAEAALASLVEVAEAARRMVEEPGFIAHGAFAEAAAAELRHALETIEGASPQKEAP